MDDVTNGSLLGWLIDAAAAAALAMAAGCGAFGFSGSAALGAAVIAVVLPIALAMLRRIMPEPREFALAPLSLSEWESVVFSSHATVNGAQGSFDEDDCLELTSPAIDTLAEDVSPKVVRLRPALPTAGELRCRIERHFQSKISEPGEGEAPSAAVFTLSLDASDALRSALLDLRRVAS
jgi:hypothetical protein